METFLRAIMVEARSMLVSNGGWTISKRIIPKVYMSTFWLYTDLDAFPVSSGATYSVVPTLPVPVPSSALVMLWAGTWAGYSCACRARKLVVASPKSPILIWS